MSPPARSVLSPTLLFLFLQAQGQEKMQAPPLLSGAGTDEPGKVPAEAPRGDISDPLVSCHGGSEGEDLG